MPPNWPAVQQQQRGKGSPDLAPSWRREICRDMAVTKSRAPGNTWAVLLYGFSFKLVCANDEWDKFW